MPISFFNRVSGRQSSKVCILRIFDRSTEFAGSVDGTVNGFHNTGFKSIGFQGIEAFDGNPARRAGLVDQLIGRHLPGLENRHTADDGLIHDFGGGIPIDSRPHPGIDDGLKQHVGDGGAAQRHHRIHLILFHHHIFSQAGKQLKDFLLQFFRYMAVKIRTHRIPEILSFLRDQWKQIEPHRPFEYFFLDSSFESQYHAEEQFGNILSYFTFIAIFIACLGLFGLSAYTAEQRSKEIGIRKVLGSSVSGIVIPLTREAIRWVVIGNIIAIPAVWFIMNRWLRNFAYRINLSIWVFIFSGLVALSIALLTVSFQTMKAATANPLDSLRYE